MVLDASLLKTQHYKKRAKGKLSNQGKRVAPSPTSQPSGYWKKEPSGRLRQGLPTYIMMNRLLVFYINVYNDIMVCNPRIIIIIIE